MFAELLQAALELLIACECTTSTGCPACIQVYSCSEYNEVVNKRAAIVILQVIFVPFLLIEDAILKLGKNGDFVISKIFYQYDLYCGCKCNLDNPQHGMLSI